MHDIRMIRQTPDVFDVGMKRRGIDQRALPILELDEQYRNCLTQLQHLQSERNQIAKEFGALKKQGADTTALSKRSDEIKSKIHDLDEQSKSLDAKLQEILVSLPNIPADDAPDGADENDNVIVRTHGVPRVLDFAPKQHFELGENLQMMDFALGAKLSGARFVVLKGHLARLERALSQFMLDTHTQEFGYTEVNPPLMVHDAAMFGVGQLPKFRDDMFSVNTGHWLISTAEVVLTNLVANDILQGSELPLRFTASTPCFRAEAGAAGRDTRGMIRQHQFTKVELVSITTKDQAIEEHERMTKAAETILQKLALPYRVMALCTGDMGFSSEKTYDIEVWLPGQNMYREISSCSRCGEFQARRMNARYRSDSSDKPLHVTTLNGSGLAVGRTLVAVLENYQQADGSIVVPDVLRPYMGNVDIIR
jgi:seryl-tRNA synthetase